MEPMSADDARILSDAELIKGGARMKGEINERRLEVTDEQRTKAEDEMAFEKSKILQALKGDLDDADAILDGSEKYIEDGDMRSVIDKLSRATLARGSFQSRSQEDLTAEEKRLAEEFGLIERGDNLAERMMNLREALILKISKGNPDGFLRS